jgi:hypothetical protein
MFGLAFRTLYQFTLNFALSTFQLAFGTLPSRFREPRFIQLHPFTGNPRKSFLMVLSHPPLLGAPCVEA